ncbi:hypothetical protein KM043_004320 [Ampulex compressa]|nr:hypothetical protein KM043_004320 [Ampulex compressa]
MDLSTTPRRAAEGVGDLQKTRVAKSVFSIRSLVDVEEADVPANEEDRTLDCDKATIKLELVPTLLELTKSISASLLPTRIDGGLIRDCGDTN